MEVDPAIDVTTEDLKTVLALLQRHLPGTAAWVYGSRVKWTSTPKSDLDLVVFATPAQRPQVGDLREAFEESNLTFQVDLFVWDDVPESFRNQIQNQHVAVVNAQRARQKPELWSAATLDELTDNIIDRRGVTPKKLGSSFVSKGYRVISAKTIKDNRVDLSIDQPRFVDDVTYRKWMKTPLQADDVILTSEAPTGKPAYIAHDSQWCLGQRLFGIRTTKHRLYGRFLFYALQSNDVQHDLLSRATGTTAEGIRQVELRRVFVTLPPLPEQRAIAHVLGSLDDKIELNRRMNATLEATARALFKSWFVDFDPVRAKMEGRDTGLPKDIADLFPDRLEELELGEIPGGWSLVPLPELIDVNPPRPLRRGKIAPYLDMANMPTSGHAPDSFMERAFSSGMRFSNGDTLMARITPCLENGKTAYVDFLRDDEIGWGSTEYIVMKARPPLPSEFAYFLARNGRFREFAIQNMSGTSGRQRVPAAALSGFSIPSPPPRVAVEFGRAAQLLLRRARSANHECRVLRIYRNALLPKLVSGDLRVTDIDRVSARH